MSAIPIQETESVLAELPQPKGPGARLKAARKSRDIDLDMVAAQLHLRRDMLIALEEDDYDHLPARVFIVGYMRNYARYIGLPAEAIIQSLDQFLPPESKDKPGLPKVGSDAGDVFKPSAKARKSPFSLISLVLLAAAVAAFFIWKEGYFEDSTIQPSALNESLNVEISSDIVKPTIAIPFEQPVPEESTPQAVETPLPQSEPEISETEAFEPQTEAAVSEPVSLEVATEQLDETTVADAEPEMAAEPVNITPMVSDSPVIVLKLAGKSWIEVRDSTGTYKLNNLYNAGTEKTFGGKPPYKVLIGNVAEASLMINGVAFDLESHNNANVARFTLDPSAL